MYQMNHSAAFRRASATHPRFRICQLTSVMLLVAAGCRQDSGSTADRAGDAQPAMVESGTGRESQFAGGSASERRSVSRGIRFTERTSESGVSFSYANGEETGHFAILESLGGGGGLLDVDGDGWLDVILAGGGGFGADRQIHGAETGLFRNLGGWRFHRADAEARISTAPWYSHGIIGGDFDNDGFIDVLVTGYGGLQLFHNHGDGTFAEVSQSAGLTDASWSSSAAWGDLNGDSWPDLYVAHYVNWSFENHPTCHFGSDLDVCPPRDFDPLPDLLYLSGGDRTFRDGTLDAGLQSDGKGLGVVAADLDLDRDVDIYVGNDTVPNFLYRNDGHARLSNEALFSGTAVGDTGTPEGSMGVDVGDYNGDGLPDIWVANYENESFALYRNGGNLLFQHVSRPTGVTATGALYVGWGTLFIDCDRDGDEDLVATNGHVIRHPTNAPLRQSPLLLENLNGTRFLNVVEQAGDLNQSRMGRGLASGDIDRDGDIDLLLTNTNEPAELLSNESDNEHNWFSIRLIGTVSSRDPVGAFVRLKSDAGSDQVRQVKGGGSYASTSAAALFFGLGTSTTVKEIEVLWPSGAVSRIEHPPANRHVILIESRTAVVVD